ncbi:MAG: asparaginase [Treponema sp.]|nr:asparaginase [Treponema sp.]
MGKKKICILTLGGTIAFSPKQSDGAGPIVDLTPFINSLDEVKSFADVEVKALMRSSSSALHIDDIIMVGNKIKELIKENYDGFIVIQGTDTIEETAFMLGLMVQSDHPVIVTGAMRNPDMRGADGPANVLACIRVAASDTCRGIGSMVVFNDEIHSGLFVRKIHPQSTEAFASECGPLGYLAEGIPSLRVTPVKRPIPWINPKGATARVPVYAVPLGDDGALLAKVEEVGCSGLVVAGLGGGHVPAELVEPLENLAKKIPVILASRIGRGDMLTSTYSGYPGSETSLLGRGLISSGLLDPRKARILLILLQMSGCTKDQIAESFRIFSSKY